MFRPWRPIECDIECHPELIYEMTGRSLRIRLIQIRGSKLELDIQFEECVAGLQIIDESVYQSFSTIGFPESSDFDDQGFAPLPWPLWKESATSRAHLYGDLGRVLHRSMDSYYIVGCDTVILIDVADGEPRVTVREPNNSLERTRER